MSEQTVYDEAMLVVMARNLRIRIDQKARTIFVPQRNSRRFGKLVLITEFPEPKKTSRCRRTSRLRVVRPIRNRNQKIAQTVMYVEADANGRVVIQDMSTEQAEWVQNALLSAVENHYKGTIAEHVLRRAAMDIDRVRQPEPQPSVEPSSSNRDVSPKSNGIKLI